MSNLLSLIKEYIELLDDERERGVNQSDATMRLWDNIEAKVSAQSDLLREFAEVFIKHTGKALHCQYCYREADFINFALVIQHTDECPVTKARAWLEENRE